MINPITMGRRLSWQNHPENRSSACSQCDSDAYLPGPVGDGVGDNAIQPDRGEHQRDHSEDTGQDSEDSLTNQQFVNLLRERLHVVYEEIRVDTTGFCLECRDEGLRANRGAHDKAAVMAHVLLRRTVVQNWRGRLSRAVVENILHNTDDGIRLATVILAGIVANLPAKGIYGPKELPGKRLVYHGHFS